MIKQNSNQYPNEITQIKICFTLEDIAKYFKKTTKINEIEHRKSIFKNLTWT